MQNPCFVQKLSGYPVYSRNYGQGFFADFFYNTNYFSLDAFFSKNNSTNSESVEKENRNHIDKLRNNEFYFVQILLYSSFEDGNSNEAIEYIKEQLSINSVATSSWMAEFFVKNKNRDDDRIEILYGLLRIIAYLNDRDCFDYIHGNLLLILQTALQSDIVYLQEAALMVIESWRDNDCLYLLKRLEFEDSYIQKYADIIKNELTSELEDNSVCLSE